MKAYGSTYSLGKHSAPLPVQVLRDGVCAAGDAGHEGREHLLPEREREEGVAGARVATAAACDSSKGTGGLFRSNGSVAGFPEGATCGTDRFWEQPTPAPRLESTAKGDGGPRGCGTCNTGGTSGAGRTFGKLALRFKLLDHSLQPLTAMGNS